MTTYYRQEEIRHSMKLLVDEYIKECTTCKELSEDFIDLLKHNFLAKYVYYNAESNSIEIGVEVANESNSYPEIKIYNFPISGKKEWLTKSFKNGINDFNFYGGLLNRRKSVGRNADVVVI